MRQCTIYGVEVVQPTTAPRVEELLSRMTLEEKVGQLVQVTPGVTPDVEQRIRSGRLGSIYGIDDPVAIARYQDIARNQTRTGVPLIVGNDVIHGYHTIFPIPLAEACTWNPPLVERAAQVAAEEAWAVGTDWIFAPMVDICRDPRWGRIAEGAGEDPYLGSLIAAARVRGFQSSGRIAACPKHYVAYGAAEAGRDYNTVDISERTLRDVYLPPFKAAFDAGAPSVMSAFNELSGVPASANPFTLRTVLLDEWAWPGVVLSDYTAIAELVQHGIATDLKDAARVAILSGVDMDMMSDAYDRHLAALVTEGAVPLSIVDDAVRRVLALKLQLGLFDRPRIDPAQAEQAMLTDANRALALDVARESMVLLKNDGAVLPLSRDSTVAVVGPLAEARRDLLGCWAPMGNESDVETVLEGISGYTSNITRDVTSADVVIAVVGETANLSGEAHSRAHLGLPGDQQVFMDALVASGKPVVCVLMTGRPLAVATLAQQVDALLVAWHGGIRAGRAVADLLYGVANPCGRLTATFPRTEGQIPVYFARKNTGRPAEGQGTLQFDEPFKSTYLDEPNAPLFPFGFGLTYTTFVYSDLKIELPVDRTLAVSARLENIGPRGGTEVAQLYVRDLVASVTRPVRELKAFQRVSLEPGEARTLRFEVPVEQLGFTGLNMQYTVEPGEFKLWVGPDSARGLEGGFNWRQ